MTSAEYTTGPRTTYPQDWPAYNRAQQNEKDHLLVMLKELCETIEEAPKHNPRGGRPATPLSEKLFAMILKVYSGFASRRFTSDLRAAHQQGLLSRELHFNATTRAMSDPDLTEHLQALIELSATPLKAVERHFAIDSTGFATTTYNRWLDHKWGKMKTKQGWIKTHLMCGVKTNIVTAALATTYESADTKQLPLLLERTAEHFTIDEVSADKAYSSKRNLREIDAVGADPYIPFKSYSKGSQNRRSRYDRLWEKAWHMYHYRRDEFDAHYHQRSNVESTMAMIKAKFGSGVKSKSPDGQVNEVLCKLVCHNICVLIQSFYELGIESEFSPAPSRLAPNLVYLHDYRARYA